MPRKDYEWDFAEPPPIGPHSLAKHRILREYVEEYVRVLTSNPRIDRLVLNLVDGFAGGGLYVDHAAPTIIHPGSPQILLDAVSPCRGCRQCDAEEGISHRCALLLCRQRAHRHLVPTQGSLESPDLAQRARERAGDRGGIRCRTGLNHRDHP